MLDVSAYMDRIGYAGPRDATATTLQALQYAHLLSVPFENLDIHLGRPIQLDEDALFDKIVVRRRGGFCYELNGLFAALLRALGFAPTLLAAGVARASGGFGPEFDHLALLVELEERWLVDVGFGDSFRAPLQLDDPGEQARDGQRYRVVAEDGCWTLFEGDAAGDWQPQYRFSLQPHQLSDYAEMCRYHQTSPDSSFTQRRVCTRATPEGRITLSDLRLITTQHGERTEQLLGDEDAYRAVLREQFGVALD